MKKYIFNLFLAVYCISYLFPFQNGWLGYQIELDMWQTMLDDEIPDANIAVIWSCRCLVNVLLLGIYWLRIPEVASWMEHHTDKAFLNKLLLVLLLLLVVYPFIFEDVLWNWGALFWAVAAILVGIVHCITEEKALVDHFYSLEHHLVELEDSSLK